MALRSSGESAKMRAVAIMSSETLRTRKPLWPCYMQMVGRCILGVGMHFSYIPIPLEVGLMGRSRLAIYLHSETYA